MAIDVNDATNAAPIVITTGTLSPTTHGLSTGDMVEIASVGGNTAANGMWLITVVNSTSFSLNESYGNDTYTSGGTVTQVEVDPDNLNSTTVVVSHETTVEGQDDPIDVGDVVEDFVPIGYAIANGDKVFYQVSGGGEYERGVGTYNSASDEITRERIIETSDNDYGDDKQLLPQDFEAGSKTVTVELVSDVPVAEDGLDKGVIFTSNPSVPVPLCEAILGPSVEEGSIHGTITSDLERQHSGSNWCLFTKRDEANDNSPGKIRLFLMKNLVFGPVATYVDVPITKTDGVANLVHTLFSRINFGAPSAIPFAYDTNKIPSVGYASTLAGYPADVFAYADVVALAGEGTATITSTSSFGPVLDLFRTGGPTSLTYDIQIKMFYLNWNSPHARNNANVGSPKGHELRLNESWRYLDCESESGWSSDWITDDNYGAKVKRRYLYLGTVNGPNDGYISCRPGFRGVWNYWKKIDYEDIIRVGTPNSWIPPGVVNYSYINSAFDHNWLNPLGVLGDQPRVVRAAITFHGNMRVAVMSWNPIDKTWLVANQSPDLHSSVAGRSDYDVSNVIPINNLAIGPTTPYSGVNGFAFHYKLGVDGIGTPIRFFGDGKPFVIINYINPAVASNAGPCVMTVRGSC